MGVDPLSIFVFFVSTAFQMQQQSKMKRKMEAAADKRKGTQFTVKNETISLPVIYGRQLIGGVQYDHKNRGRYDYVAPEAGTQTFDSTDTVTTKTVPVYAEDAIRWGEEPDPPIGSAQQYVSGKLNESVRSTKNEFLYAKHALCHAGINAVRHVLVGDKPHYHHTYKKGQRIIVYPEGGPSAVMQANGYSDTETFTNVAYAAEIFRLDRDKQNYTGAPDVQFIVEGQKVRYINYNEQSETYSVSQDKVYSNNPAYVLMDYLTNNLYGKGLSDDEIDLEAFYKAAQVCDTIVATNVEVSGHIWGSLPVSNYPTFADFPSPNAWGYEDLILKDDATETYYKWNHTNSNFDNPTGEFVVTTLPTRDVPLYECNMTIDTEQSIRDNIEAILNTMHYAELVWSSEGKYKLLLDYPETDQETEALVTHVFNKDNILRDSLSISFPSAEDRYNQVTVNYLNEHENFKEDTVSWPEKGTDAYLEYLDNDNGKPLETTINPLCTDPYHALAKAEQMVRSSRSIYTINFLSTRYGLTVEPGDFITVTLDEIGINTPTIFRVEEVKVTNDFSCEITAYYFDADVLAWNVDDAIAYKNREVFDTTLAPVSNITVSQTNLRPEDVCVLTWDYPDDQDEGFFTYEVYYKPSSHELYYLAGEAKQPYFNFQKLVGIANNSDYDFYIVVKSFIGSRSAPTYLLDQTLNNAPNIPQGIDIVDELYLTNNASGVKSRVILEWEPDLGNIQPSHYSVEYRKTEDAEFTSVGTSSQVKLTINDLSPGTYIFKVTPFSVYELQGPSLEVEKIVSGLSAPPATPQNFTGNINEGQINLSWSLPTDLDVIYGGSSEIRYHADTGENVSWDSASILVQNLNGNTNNKTVPTLKGTFLIKFKDSSGNYSNTPASFVSTFEDLTFNAVDAIDEDTANFSGTKINCSVVNSNLELDSGETSMEYFFHDYVDLAEAVTVRAVPYIDAVIFEDGVFVSDYVSVAAQSQFAGPVSNASLAVYISITQDDPAGTPTWSDYSLLTIGSFNCRAMRFKLIGAVESENTAVVIDNLGVTIDKKDIIKTGSSTSSTSADTTVTFNTAFYGGIGNTNNPSIGVQIITGQLGDQPVIVSRDKTGFTYSVYNNSSRVQRSIDWQAIGQ